jgi:hypothetical protein
MHPLDLSLANVPYELFLYSIDFQRLVTSHFIFVIHGFHTHEKIHTSERKMMAISLHLISSYQTEKSNV